MSISANAYKLFCCAFAVGFLAGLSVFAPPAGPALTELRGSSYIANRVRKPDGEQELRQELREMAEMHAVRPTDILRRDLLDAVQVRAVTSPFKRMRPANEQALRQELLKVPEIGLMGEQHGWLLHDWRNEVLLHQSPAYRETVSSGRQDHGQLPIAVLPNFTKRQKDLWSLLYLVPQSESSCQLNKEAATNLDTWATAIRRLQLVSMPTPDGKWAPPTRFPELEQGHLKLANGVSALAQMLCAEDERSRQLLVGLLKQVASEEASVALARIALFDVSSTVRQMAIACLDGRSRKQYRHTLLEALRHPWPPIAEHAAEALVALDDKEAVPALERLLDEPDPCLPVVKPGNGRAPQVAQLVRINHMRNCVLCHATSIARNDPLRGFVPSPDESLSPSYYGERSRVGFVRADVTYLRQDFSLMQEVAEPQRWPKEQRFDFLVRNRDATTEELAELQKNSDNKEYPQRAAVLFALRELAGP